MPTFSMFQIMPRSSKGVKRLKVDSTSMERAVKGIIAKEITFAEAVRTYQVCRTTLRRKLQLWKESGNTDVSTYVYAPKLDIKRIFSPKEETNLVKYATTLCYMHYGLTVKRFREVAYKYAIAKGKTVPKNWTANETASVE